MNKRLGFSLVGLALGMAVEFALAADVAAPASGVPVYKPPMRGAPASRVGGGSRGAEDSAPRISVLAPDHTGYTSQEQSILYWYLSKPVATRLEITISDEQSVKPLLEKPLGVPAKAGIQTLRLKDYGVHLKPGVEYRWFVGLVANPQQRSGDIIAGGTIARLEAEPAYQDKIAKASPTQVPFIQAEQGYWYDAMASISELIAAKPGDAELLKQRAALLDQVGLGDLAK